MKFHLGGQSLVFLLVGLPPLISESGPVSRSVFRQVLEQPLVWRPPLGDLLYSSVSMHHLHIISKYIFLAPTILFISVRVYNYELNLGSLLLSQPKHAQCQINLFFLYIIILPNQGWPRLSLYLQLVPSLCLSSSIILCLYFYYNLCFFPCLLPPFWFRLLL